MIKFENCEVLGWEHAIRGMRNPMNSWEKSDSTISTCECEQWPHNIKKSFDKIGPNDLNLMTRLRNAGTDHRKFMRMITVYVDILAPLYWWKEMDTYRVGVEKNSCSTMHKIAAKEFTLEDFSCEHLISSANGENTNCCIYSLEGICEVEPTDVLEKTVEMLNKARELYLETKDKKYWWQMIQLLPSSYNQRRTVMLNYEVLANIYKSRRNHKLDEWRELCAWIETLPYSELIVGERSDGTESESKRFVEIAQVFQKSFQEGLEEGLNENKELVFKIPKDQISPEALKLLEKGFAVDMSIGFKE